MLPHAKATIVVTVEAAEVGEFTNKATFGSETSPEPITRSQSAAEILPAADLAITKTAPATVAPDGELTYGLHVENHGPSIAHKVVVTDPLPAGVDFVSPSEGCAAAGTASSPAKSAGGELAVGDAADFQVTVHVPFALGGQSLINTATVAAEEGDPHPEDNSEHGDHRPSGPPPTSRSRRRWARPQAGQPLDLHAGGHQQGPVGLERGDGEGHAARRDHLQVGGAEPGHLLGRPARTVTCRARRARLGRLGAGVDHGRSRRHARPARCATPPRSKAPSPTRTSRTTKASVEGPVTPAAPSDPNLKVVKTADTSSPTVGAPFALRRRGHQHGRRRSEEREGRRHAERAGEGRLDRSRIRASATRRARRSPARSRASRSARPSTSPTRWSPKRPGR